MSNETALLELARFIGQSRLSTEDAVARLGTANAIAGRLHVRPAKRGVADLLGVVLTLSARTRRAALPKVDIDLDVFAPDGRRAVRLTSR